MKTQSRKMMSLLFQSRRRPSERTKSDSNYYSFYNIKKTKLSARYPFLPKKQIERKIKHLWERASAEKRATLCLTSSSTTAKSFFKGSILQGLCKKKVPLDQISSYGGHLSKGSPASVACSCPGSTLCSSIKDPQSLTSGKRTLSSAKEHISTGRVSFNLDQSSPPSRPNTRSSLCEQKFNEGSVKKTKREKSKLAEDVSQGHLKKRELSLEEKKMYEFEDDGARSHDPSVTEVPVKGDSMTRLRAGVTEHVFDPEQYNLESTVNSGIFIDDNQSPTMTPGHRPPEPTEMRLNDKSPQNFANGKKTCGRRNAKSTNNPTISLGKDQDVKGSSKPNVAASGQKDDVPSTIGDIDDVREVPWIVSTRDSSSDEVRDNSDDDVGNGAFYEYYHKSSSESSAQTLPSLSQESEDILGSPYENKILFSWNGECFTKKSSSLGTHTPTHSQLSLVSMDTAEVMSMSSTKVSLSPHSPKFEVGFSGKLMPSSTQWFQTPPDIKTESPMSQKQKMRIPDGMTMETPKSSRHHGLDADKPCTVEDVKQALMVIVSPTSRKRKMKGQGGEDMVSMTTAKKTKENNNQKPVSPKKAVASQGASLVTSSNKRNVLVETNSKPTNPALKTNRTKQEKEDHARTVRARRSGRMKNKESMVSMVNGSLTEEGCAAEGGNNSRDIKYSPKVLQPNGEVKDLPHKNRNTKREIKVSSQMTGREEMFQSDGILCDLFQPNRSSQKRSFNSPSEIEFCQSCSDPVLSHLFLEENFFL